ncbi:putative natural killer cell receptor 2B4-like [Triplophysa rosa]|uniref:Natural killer cell receptor 2B4-like n=1 Tax=Triplophysa rosa TaxID=992332 RepID=A0A9W8C7G3_TRIRA|nr:putative natural killer cell receptor 2B4-like [Triplophysa rosa]
MCISDPVDTPLLTLLNSTMISVNSCIVDVTCIGHDLTLGSRYYSNCSEEEVTSLKNHNLALYCKEDVVVCNYSNPVSWKNDTIKMKQLCTTHENVISEVSSFFSLQWLTVFVVSVTLLLLAGAAVLYCSYRKYKKGTQQSESTIYAEVEPGNEVQRDLEMSERSQNPHTVYSSESLVQTKQCHNHPKTTYYTMGQQTKKSAPAENNLSVYCLVSK